MLLAFLVTREQAAVGLAAGGNAPLIFSAGYEPYPGELRRLYPRPAADAVFGYLNSGMWIGPAGAAQTQLIRGFFSESLTPSLAASRGMKPALLVDVDVDLYISAYQCLDWMFTHRLIVPGTVVYYDDVSIVKADAGGELKAHEELTAKWKVEWRKIHDSCWEVESIGVGPN